MAHPDHDQVIGRLVGARLRGAADRRAVSGGAAEAHPDAETWAAYVDGGLQADEVVRVETHLAGCPACRRLVAVLVPEVSSGAAPAVQEDEVPAAGRGVVIPFPRRQVFVWMAAAAGLLMAVTLWSVSRLGDLPASKVAMSAPQTGAAVTPQAPPVASPAASASEESAQSRLAGAKVLDQTTTRPPTVAERGVARQEEDKRKPDAPNDALAARSDMADAQARQAAQALATPSANASTVPPQANTVPAGARPRGPSVNQQANQQQYAQPAAQAPKVANSPPPLLPAPPVAVARATPAPAPAPAEPAAPQAQGDAAAAATRERRANEQPPAQVAETVTITSSGAGAGRSAARSQPERSQAAGAEREGQARSKDEAPTFKAFGYLAGASGVSLFAEPGGRLQWRIADGRRLESSSDGGARWTAQYTARDQRDRLRAGTAPAIDSAWVVGERGLVLRFVVPGGWAEVARPAAATLVAVSATGVQSARVSADDGRVFETTDGGATWTQVSPGAGPR